VAYTVQYLLSQPKALEFKPQYHQKKVLTSKQNSLAMFIPFISVSLALAWNLKIPVLILWKYLLLLGFKKSLIRNEHLIVFYDYFSTD
jgi:hypothetical protein